jgi:hypothetical protein
MTALDYFDVPDNGAAAHAAGYAQADNPHGFSTPDGIAWARQWGEAEVSSRRQAGTYGATDEDYRAGGLKPPERTSTGAPRAVLGGVAYIVGPGGSVAALGSVASFSAVYRSALEEAERAQRAWAAAMTRTAHVIRSTTFSIDRDLVARLYGVPTSILGYGPVRLVVDEPDPAPPADRPVPADWSTAKREDLLKPVFGPVHDEPVLRRYLLDEKPLEVELDPPFEREVYGIVPTGVRRLEQMRATMQEPRPELRAPKHLGSAPTTRTSTARSRRRQP